MKKLLTKRDLLLILVLLLTGLCFLLLRPNATSAAVQIEQDGQLLSEIPLSTVTDPQIIPLDCTPPLTVTVTKEGAFVSSAQCPDQTCVRTGRLTRPGDLACCLPARVIVRIVSQTEASSTDAITG